MIEIKIDFTGNNGQIKPLHGVGQPPFTGMDFSMCSYLKEAGIPFSRLHDVGGPYGRNQFVDIPNIFRDFEADPALPESYDFAFTDALMAALVKNGVEPFFRLGVTIENYIDYKAYRIFPPKDNLKWAEICEGIIRHYTEGWADGFYYNIRYWEIWNEPDNGIDNKTNQMWQGTKEEYYELYNVSAKYLKSRFPHLKIGGYASCGFYAIFRDVPKEAHVSARFDYFITFLDGFLDSVKASGAPLDFFSWHTYDSIEHNVEYARYAKKRMNDAGFPDIEIFCNEWNLALDARGTMRHAAETAANMLMFQHEPVDGAMFYDARLGTSIYGGLFDPMARKPYPTFYSFCAFNELYRSGTSVPVEIAPGGPVYCAAAKDSAVKCAVIANTSSVSQTVSLNSNPVKCLSVSADGLVPFEFEDFLPPYSVFVMYFD